MSTGGIDWDSAAVLDVGGSNTFDLTDTIAGATRPYWGAWWTYTPAGDGLLHVDTNGTEAADTFAADTFLDVYSGPDLAHAVLTGSDDDGGDGFLSSLQVSLTGGVTYHILVGTYDSDGDTITRYHLNATFGARTATSPHPTYTIDGITIPVGGDRITAAGLVTVRSVTTPTVGFLTDEPLGFVDDPHVWYQLTAPATGKLFLDSSLSYAMFTDVEFVSANLSVYRSNVGAAPSGLSDCTELVDGNFFSGVTLDVTAGVTYLIAVWNFQFPGDVSLILRVSDYGVTSDWFQPADQAWVVSGENALHEQVLPTAPAFLDGLGGTAGYGGRYVIDRAFAGFHPGILPEAPRSTDCAWHHVAEGCDSGQWWSPDPDNPDVDIKANWAGGPGVCSELFPTRTGSNINDVGATYGTGMETDPHANTVTQGYGITRRYWVSHVTPGLGPTGGLPAPTPPPGGTVEYEATEGELLGIDAAPDQLVPGDTGLLNGSPTALIFSTRWFGKATPIDENPGNLWGPKTNYPDPDDPDAVIDRFILGGIDANSGFAGEQDFQLTDFPPDPSGPADWETIDPALIAAALSYEQAWQEQWDAGIDLSLISNYGGGLRFVGLFPEVLDTFSNPFGNIASASTTIDQRRHGQTVALRVRVKPPRYRTHAPPVIPPVDAQGPPIRLQPRDDTRGNDPVARNYPVDVGTTSRNYPVMQ